MHFVREKRIQLMALDFDKTIINIHTGGRWRHRPSKLCRHVRPEFPCLISTCWHEGISVAATSFSKQIDLIQKVLASVVKAKKQSEIPIFGGDAYGDGKQDGKQSHLILAIDYFNAKRETDKPTNPQTTLLIDDDPHNIQVAERDGYQTILYGGQQK